MDRSNSELADRLADQKRDIEKLGFALEMITGNPNIDNIVHRVNCWIDDACDALRRESGLKD